MRQSVTVQLPQINPAVLRAVSALRTHPRLSLRIAGGSGAHVDPKGRVLRIEPGSRLEPVLTLLWGAGPAVDADVLRRDAGLGLSVAIWGRGASGYEWSGRSRPLPERSCVGVPDPHRPWVLIAPHARVDAVKVAALSGLVDPQLHFLKPRPDAKASGSVWWLPTRKVLLSLLGRVHAVVASQGPLAWDAARMGVPVIEPEPVRALPAEGVERRLACMVPGRLVHDGAFWRAVGVQLADGVNSQEWGTMAWTLLAREAPSRKLALGAWQRKLLKLKRDPSRFWADSKVMKRFVGPQG